LYDRQKLLGGMKEYSTLFNGITMDGPVDCCDFYSQIHSAAGLLAWFHTFLLIGIGRFTIRRIIYACAREAFPFRP
jgi:hypothetical protein